MLKFNKILSDPKIEITALEISRNPYFLIFSVAFTRRCLTKTTAFSWPLLVEKYICLPTAQIAYQTLHPRNRLFKTPKDPSRSLGFLLGSPRSRMFFTAVFNHYPTKFTNFLFKLWTYNNDFNCVLPDISKN